MKIIQVCPRFLPDIGGIETHVYEISKRLCKGHEVKGHEVLVYTTDPSGRLPSEETIDGIKVRRFKSYAPSESFFFSPGLYSALKKESCDILHVHSFQAFPALFAHLAMGRDRAKKFIFTPHFHPKGGTAFRTALRMLYDRIQKRVLFRADRVVCVSKHEKKLLNNKFNLPLRKMAHVPNGIDMKRFENLPKVKNNSDFQMLFVGRLEKYKRVQWILVSLKRLIEMYPNKDIRFVIVGDGPYKKDLVGLCSRLELGANVDFKQNLTPRELLKEYCKCDVFVMPSEYEAFSIATLEALACGKAVIASNVGGLAELVDKKFLIENQNDLDELLPRVLEGAPTVKFDFKKYSWDSVSEQLCRLYSKYSKTTGKRQNQKK